MTCSCLCERVFANVTRFGGEMGAAMFFWHTGAEGLEPGRTSTSLGETVDKVLATNSRMELQNRQESNHTNHSRAVCVARQVRWWVHFAWDPPSKSRLWGVQILVRCRRAGGLSSTSRGWFDLKIYMASSAYRRTGQAQQDLGQAPSDLRLWMHLYMVSIPACHSLWKMLILWMP